MRSGTTRTSEYGTEHCHSTEHGLYGLHRCQTVETPPHSIGRRRCVSTRNDNHAVIRSPVMWKRAHWALRHYLHQWGGGVWGRCGTDRLVPFLCSLVTLQTMVDVSIFFFHFVGIFDRKRIRLRWSGALWILRNMFFPSSWDRWSHCSRPCYRGTPETSGTSNRWYIGEKIPNGCGMRCTFWEINGSQVCL